MLPMLPASQDLTGLKGPHAEQPLSLPAAARPSHPHNRKWPQRVHSVKKKKSCRPFSI